MLFTLFTKSVFIFTFIEQLPPPPPPKKRNYIYFFLKNTLKIGRIMIEWKKGLEEI